MSTLDVKLVKVDNWGIYFLQRLKHFFNRTDYCDLTLQFQDNAQLKVHRLVLSGCTEYFELLERTCEMYEDCLVMPDDLQADVVVPIVNFMYTGQLEFRMDLLERLYLTSQIMEIPILTKLLDAHRSQATITPIKSPSVKRSYSKSRESLPSVKQSTPTPSNTSSVKRQYSTAFNNAKKTTVISNKHEMATKNAIYHQPDIPQPSTTSTRKVKLRDPRPTRYELPEELDTDNIFDNSFTNISYTSSPLMVHPDSAKHYPSKKSNIFGEASGSHKFAGGTSTVDIVECRKMTKNDSFFEDDTIDDNIDSDMYQVKEPSSPQVYSQLFDQVVDQNDGPKVTIVTKDAKQESNIDHAKIISEVLKKYPHLVKSNKNIKLKILNTPSPSVTKTKPAKRRKPNTPQQDHLDRVVKIKSEKPDYTFETDVLDSKEAAKLIALGADNIEGPWICLICGTPGKALHFTSYYKFRRHLVEVHNEKPVSNMCEYCGLKSPKRNYLLHHLLTKHGVEPPPSYHFPKCNQCSYVALTEAFLIRHKLTHNDSKHFRCNVCVASFANSYQLMDHIRTTGHKYSSDNKKPTLQCIYCMKVFSREGNLYAHLKIRHKQSARDDGIIEDSDEEQDQSKTVNVKYEVPAEFEDDVETQYQIMPDGNIEVISKNRTAVLTTSPSTPAKQKILNSGFSETEIKTVEKTKSNQNISNIQEEYTEEVVVIDNTEYVMRNNQLIPKKKDEYVLSDLLPSQAGQHLTPSTSMGYSNIQNTHTGEMSQHNIIAKKAANINQPIQIVVSNEEEYKALMNSNHSIIFDDGDSNKTLTVLSTPESTLNAPDLGLNGTQTNDMMIIQDNYPINVSEALPSDNSNIVVVYGHSIGDQNKQFQIITSQDIGPQFVQSSAVITQNYGTLTTSTPVMAAHVLDTQVEGTWQNNIQNTQQESITQEMSEITVIRSQEISTVDTQHNIALNDLPEVTLTPEKSLPITEIQLQENLNESNDADELPEGEEQHASLIAMDVDISTELVALPTKPATLTLVEKDTTEPGADNTEADTTELVKDTLEPVADITDTGTNNTEAITADISENVTDTTVLVTDSVETITDTSIAITELVADSTEVLADSTEVLADSMNVATDSTEVEENSSRDTTEVVTDTTEMAITDADKCSLSAKPNEPLLDSETYTEPEDNTYEELVLDQPTKDKGSSNELEEQDPSKTLLNEASEDIEMEPPNIEKPQDENVQENSELIITKVAKEQIQSLTSEWSEDEYDVIEDSGDKNEEVESQDMEESIENIQQEMDKHSSTVEPASEADEGGDNDLSDLKKQLATTLPSAAPLEKISSLLNDWDENDSQENDSLNGTDENNTIQIGVPESVEHVKEAGDTEGKKLYPKKDDKIQSLVSDWDDDEEDAKIS